MRALRLFLVVVLFLSSASQVYPQKRRGPQLREDVDLPSDYSLDFQLAKAERSKLRNGGAPLVGTQANPVGEEVFRTLIAGFSLPYTWTFTVNMNSSEINAGSLPDGEVSVDGGLARLIGSDRGLWAAVLSHEIAHVARRHGVIKHLYRVYLNQLIAYYQVRARAGDKSATWVLLGLKISGPIAYDKLSRKLEHDADIQGMMLMARAGYHPDNVFAVHHLLRITTGESSKFAAFFQDHPRWETRDQRNEQAYSAALAEYNQRWPDPSLSPGGQPPVVAFAGNPRSTTNKVSGTADLELPLYCRNTSGPVNLVIRFSKDKHPLQATEEQYRDSAGNLEVRQKVICLDKEDAARLDVHLPASLVSEKDRKAQAQAFVMTSNGEVLERFKSVDVSFPKSDLRTSKVMSAHQTQTAVLVQAERVTDVNHGTTATQPPPAIQNIAAPQETSIREPTNHAAAGLVSTRGVGIGEPVDRVLQPTAGPPSHPADTPSSQSSISTFGIISSTDGANGLKIVKVSPSSPAATAGLQAGDVIVALNGIKVTDDEALNTEFANYKQGSKIIATIIHASWIYNVTLTTGDDVSASDHSFGLLFPGHTSRLNH